MKQIWWSFRAWFCEVLIGWTLIVSPRGYVPSYIELLANEMKKNLAPRGRTSEHQSDVATTQAAVVP